MSLSTFCHLLLLLLLLLFLLRLLLLFLPLSSSSSLLRAFYVRFSLMPRYLASSSTRSVSGPSVHPFPFHPISPIFSRLLSLSLACSLFLSLSLSLLRSRCSFPPPDCPSSVSFFSLRALFLSPPRPIARSAGIRGIFEPVHDGRLLQGRTFLQHTPKSFRTAGSIREMKFVRGSREGRPLH